MTTLNPTQSNTFFATKQLLSLMNVNIKEKLLADLLINSRDFPSLAAIVDTLETLKIKNLPVFLKREQLEEIPLPAITQLTIDGDLFVPVRKIENQNVEWCHDVKGWQNDSIEAFSQKWNGIALLVDANTVFYAQKKFGKQNSYTVRDLPIIVSTLAFLIIYYLLGFFNILFLLDY